MKWAPKEEGEGPGYIEEKEITYGEVEKEATQVDYEQVYLVSWQKQSDNWNKNQSLLFTLLVSPELHRLNFTSLSLEFKKFLKCHQTQISSYIKFIVEWHP